MDKIKPFVYVIALLPIFLWIFLWASFFIPGGYLLIPLVIVGILYFYTKHSQIKNVDENINTTEIQKETSSITTFGRALLTTFLVVVLAAVIIFLFEKFKPARSSSLNSYYEIVEVITLLVSIYFVYRIRK